METRNRSSPAFSSVGLEPGQIEDPVRIDRDELDGIRGKPVAVENAGMLGRSQEEPGRPRLPEAAEAWRQDEIRSLGPAAGEDDVLHPGADETGHFLAGALDFGPGGPAFGMDGRGISGQQQRAEDDLGSLRPQGRSRIMVEIYALADRHGCVRPHEILAIDPGCRAKAPQPHLSDVFPRR